MNEQRQECIANCSDCHDVCLETVAYCLQQGGKRGEENHVRLLLDCAEICQTSANFMLRDSDLHGYTCWVCAEVCERCAQECERFGDDPQLEACAEACRQCAASCRQMTTVIAGRYVAPTEEARFSIE